MDHLKAWEERARSACPTGGWLLVRTGWDARSHSQQEYLNADDDGAAHARTLGECARWVAEESPVIGLGVETVGTDAGAAAGFDPMFPCHTLMHGAGKYGLTQLQNLARLPPTGAVVVAGPLRIVTGLRQPGPGAGPRRAVTEVARRDGRPDPRRARASGRSSASSGPATSIVSNAMVAAGARFVTTRHEAGATTMADAYCADSAARSRP